ncbi:hypothetical protein [Celeribacter halophilus]|uniref:Uncharacterized protein n=1 Tax=Celeribacter halophilus TaxID=576117 RepID=A0A1I3URD4_9RHOB|nr:hypothetical protein [Celeribacter halophilus]PZX10083.1 hypothetical protein LX82_02644 [Celeribacter halophilus]SFJ84391.1 hypothetical protein SAMN04488138_1128 [Celeribacter halophilus]
MMDPGAAILIPLLIYIGMFVFMLWVVLSVVNSLKRIASALENMSVNGSATYFDRAADTAPTKTPAAQQKEREARDPAYKYIPKK